MKKWINPPANMLLTVLGLLLIAYTAWALFGLKLKNVESAKREYTRVAIPDSSTLSTPPLRDYMATIERPLFWEARKPYVPPKPEPVVVQKEETPVDTKFPNGRLIGVVDMGSSKMAVLKDNAKSHYLKLDDSWGAWNLAEIDKDSARFQLGKEEKVLSLIDDFKAPKPSRHTPPPVPNVAKASAAKQVQRQLESELDKPRRLPAAEINRKDIPVGAVPKGMSIKEALAARQRLIAERWRKQAE